jgi:epoxyqueuosine reductase QueG
MQTEIIRILSRHLVPDSNFIYGIADLGGLLDDDFGDFRYAISIGKKLDETIVSGIKGGPTHEYYTHYRSMNTDLSELSQKIAGDLRKAGNEIRRIEPSVTTDQLDTVYETTLRTPLSHKMAATLAGLGWIGKTDLFISKKFGPRLRLVTILTSTPLKTMLKPIKKSRCGTCNLCVEACPAKAANGKLWDTTVDRDEFFDAFKCRKQCAEFGRTRLSMDARVCGICVAVCPVGLGETNET